MVLVLIFALSPIGVYAAGVTLSSDNIVQNADFATNLNNWNGGLTWQSYGANSATGGCASYWGLNANLSQSLNNVPAGIYSMTAWVLNDTAPGSLTMYVNDAGQNTIKSSALAFPAASNTWGQVEMDDIAISGGTITLGIGLTSNNGQNAWFCVDAVQLVKTGDLPAPTPTLSSDNIVQNPDFTANLNNWNGGLTWQSYGANSATGGCATYWGPSANLSQTLSNVPDGIYSMTALVLNDTVPASLTMYVNGVSQNTIKSSVLAFPAAANKWGQVEMDDIVISSGTITLGISLASSNGQSAWFCVDAVQLVKTGDLPAPTPTLSSNNIVQNADFATNLNNWNGGLTWQSYGANSATGGCATYWGPSANLSQVLSNVPAGIYSMTAWVLNDTAPASLTLYVNGAGQNTIKSSVLAFPAASNKWGQVKMDDIVISGGTITLGIGLASNNGQSAWFCVDAVQLVKTGDLPASPTAGNYVQNPGFEANGTLAANWYAPIANWTSSDTHDVYLQNYGPNGVSANFWKVGPYTAQLSQNIIGLPDGTYTLTASFANNVTGDVKLYVKPASGGASSVSVAQGDWHTETVSNVVITGGKAEIGVTVNCTSASSTNGLWAAVDNFSLTLVASGGGKIYYVSVFAGNDNNDGLSLNTPFKTISRASSVMKAGDTCCIRGGVYRETVKPANNGTATNPISFLAYGGESVTISGADLVTGAWTVDSGSVYKVPAQMNLNVGNQVFYNGEMMTEARYPNIGNGDLMHPIMGVMATGTTSTSVYDPNMPNIDWTGATIWVSSGSRWVTFTSTVTSYSNHTVTFVNNDPDGYNSAAPGGYYILSGKRAALDTAKEWYYDGSQLYLYAPGGVNPSQGTVEVKNRDVAVDLSGSQNIRLNGINVFGATVKMDANTTGCTVDSMDAQYVSHVWKAVNGYKSQTADTGIIINGTNNTVKNSEIACSSGCGVSVDGTGNQLVNCLIHDTDYIGAYAASINAAGLNQLISNNTAYNSGRSILNSEGIRSSAIRYNNFYGCGYLSYDCGVIYIVNSDGQNTEIDHNLIHNNVSPVLSVGLYLDNASHNYIVDHNVIYNIPHTGIKFNLPSEYNLMYNNTVYGSSSGGDNSVEDNWGWVFTDDTLGTQCFNNIFSDVCQFGAKTQFNYNIYKGTNPMFTNPAAGDFTLKSGSPAIDAGIVLAGISDKYNSSAPDLGAYEYGQTPWTAGCNLSNPPLSSFTKANTTYMNLVTNGGFEAGLMAPWTSVGTSAASVVWGTGMMTSTGAARASNSGLQISGGQGGIAQTISNLLPNTDYRLGVWLNVGTGLTATAGVTLNNGNSTQYSVSCAPTNGQWQLELLTFNTGNATSLTIFINKSSGSGNIYTDDIGLVNASALPKT